MKPTPARRERAIRSLLRRSITSGAPLDSTDTDDLARLGLDADTIEEIGRFVEAGTLLAKDADREGRLGLLRSADQLAAEINSKVVMLKDASAGDIFTARTTSLQSGSMPGFSTDEEDQDDTGDKLAARLFHNNRGY